MKTSFLLAVTALVFGTGIYAQSDTTGNGGKIGNMTVAAFTAANEKGGKMVAAIAPSKTPLSAADVALFYKVMAGGQRQLGISQSVLDKVTDPEVRILVRSEVEEQTGLATKLQEIATTKGIQPPAAGPDSSIENITRQIQGMPGNALNAFYLSQGGIKGHEMLLQTLTTVNTTAKDEALKKIAIATLPLIRTHLAVSKAVKAKMGGGTTAGN